MPKPITVTIGGPSQPFNRGLNTARHRTLLAPNEAQVAQWVDNSAGSLRGAYSPGTAIAQTVGAGSKFVCCSGGTDWFSSTDPDTACRIDYRTVAHTVINGGAHTYPRVQQAGYNTQLGVPAPGSGMTATGGSRPNRSYALVYMDAGAVIYPGEYPFAISNPSPIVSSGNSGATLGSIPGAGGAYARVIYATVEGDPNGTLYHYKALSSALTSWTDTGGDHGGYNVDESQPLNWGRGGHVDSETTPFDFSEALALAVLAEDTYGPGGIESDILFAVLAASRRTYIAWTHAGKPWAWPTKFQHNLQETTHALVVWQNAAYAFTDTSVWAASGPADYAISVERVSAAHPIKAGFGKTAKATPFGVMYVAREGIALLDGISSRIITKGILDPLTWLNGATYGNAAWYDGAYRLNLWGTGKTLVVDLGEGGVTVTETDIDAADLHVAYSATSNPGLFVADLATGALNPWRPTDGAAVAGAARQPWVWTTGALSLGEVARLKQFTRMRVACSLDGGTLDVTATVRDNAGVSLASHTQTLSATTAAEFWLPSTMTGNTLDLTFTPSTGDAEVYEVTVEGVYCDGN